MMPKERRVHVKVIPPPPPNLPTLPQTFFHPRFHLRRCCCSCPGMILLVPSNLLRLNSRTRTRFLHRGERIYETTTLLLYCIHLAAPFPLFSPTKTTGWQDDLSDSHSHCWSVRLSLLVFTSCHTDLVSEALAPAFGPVACQLYCFFTLNEVVVPCHFCFTLHFDWSIDHVLLSIH